MLTKKNNSNTISQESTKADEKKSSLLSGRSECCGGSPHCSTATKNETANTLHPYGLDTKKGPKTRIVVKYDVGFKNALYIRGKGANLSWDKGVPLTNIKSDEWVWETDQSFTSGEFKVLINDKQYETGVNHPLNCGGQIQYTPRF